MIVRSGVSAYQHMNPTNPLPVFDKFNSSFVSALTWRVLLIRVNLIPDRSQVFLLRLV